MKRLIPVLLLVATAACSSATSGSKPRTSYDRNLIARTELATRPTDNMHNTVRALRPNWLGTALSGAHVGTTGTGSVMVYMDGKEFGDVEMLKSVSAEAVEEARYYSNTEAQGKFGLRVTTPVIAITSRKPGS